MTPANVLPLAGVYQAAALAARSAYMQPVDSKLLADCLETLFTFDAPDILSVYKGLPHLRVGLKKISHMKVAAADQLARDTRYYVWMLAYLGQQLLKKPALAEELRCRLAQVQHQPLHLGILHPQVIANLSDIYSSTMGRLSLRIQVQGLRSALRQEAYTHKIRALLLAGIRSAVLWRQVGGHYSHLWLKKGPLVRMSQDYLEKLTHKTTEVVE